MRVPDLHSKVISALWEAAANESAILSATLVGSFATGAAIKDVSDIDLVVIVERLDSSLFQSLLCAFDTALRPLMASAGFQLRINPTLGPLKLNEPDTAVLHLMIYSRQAHVNHAVKSPFTCLDWQRSSLFHRHSLPDIYPVFGLQPHHFFSARRGASAYLKDFRDGVISFRELVPTTDGYDELPRTKLMDERDRHEFAFHIMKFLMLNFLKLLDGPAEAPEGESLQSGFFSVMPDGFEPHTALFESLQEIKQSGNFGHGVPSLTARVTAFVEDFERQFRRLFFQNATHHLFFRHARTHLNGTETFFGRSDPDTVPIRNGELEALARETTTLVPQSSYCSPLARARQSLDFLGRRTPLKPPTIDSRLLEMDYGTCEGLTVAAARLACPELFEEWAREEDPPFPGGESVGDVWARLKDFLDEELAYGKGSAVICSHNVVIRCLVGSLLNVPFPLWHRLNIPHLTPIRVTRTERMGLFLDLEEETERLIFRDFAAR